MNRHHALQDLLLRSFEDRVLTRPERDEFVGVLHARPVDPDERDRLLALAFDLFRQGVADPKALDASEWLKRVVRATLPPADRQASVAEACFSDRHDCAKRVVELFESARETVDVCVFTVTHDSIAAAMLRAHARGVALRIVTDDGKALDKGSDVARLLKAGLSIRMDRSPHHMHHKFAIFDRRVLLNGSFNWTYGASKNNRENFVLLSDPRLLAEFQQEFELLWEVWK